MSSRLSIARSNMSCNTSSLSCVEMVEMVETDEHDDLDLLLERDLFVVFCFEYPALRLYGVDEVV